MNLQWMSHVSNILGRYALFFLVRSLKPLLCSSTWPQTRWTQDAILTYPARYRNLTEWRLFSLGKAQLRNLQNFIFGKTHEIPLYMSLASSLQHCLWQLPLRVWVVVHLWRQQLAWSWPKTASWLLLCELSSTRISVCSRPTDMKDQGIETLSMKNPAKDTATIPQILHHGTK